MNVTLTNFDESFSRSDSLTLDDFVIVGEINPVTKHSNTSSCRKKKSQSSSSSSSSFKSSRDSNVLPASGRSRASLKGLTIMEDHPIVTSPSSQTSIGTPPVGNSWRRKSLTGSPPVLPHARWARGHVVQAPSEMMRAEHALIRRAACSKTCPNMAIIATTICEDNYNASATSRHLDSENTPTGLDEMIDFVPPELTEEVLLDREHNEVVAKLDFVLALVECIVEMAHAHGDPLLVSYRSSYPYIEPPLVASSCSSSGVPRTVHLQLERLSLYIRALQMLTSSMDMARRELDAGRLHSTANVRTCLKDMNKHYRDCLATSNQIISLHLRSMESSFTFSSLCADKLLYSHAIISIQVGAKEELLGNPSQSVPHYHNALVILHSLLTQCNSEEDKSLLNKYKAGIEKRLTMLGVMKSTSHA